jgi:anti-sigma factor RsiW
MKPETMPEHLSREKISALLDEASDVPGGLEHLAECEACAHEYEQMSRMRMALSGLPELEPPPGEWESIETDLGLSRPRTGPFAPVWRQVTSWPVQAAAVVALFAAGLLVGQRIDGGVSDSTDAVRTAEVPAAGSPSGDERRVEPAEAYLRTVADLEALRDRTPGPDSEAVGPEAVAARLTHLDAMIDASREALREAPADPVLNNFLFELVDERESLAGELDRALRMTAAEY